MHAGALAGGLVAHVAEVQTQLTDGAVVDAEGREVFMQQGGDVEDGEWGCVLTEGSRQEESGNHRRKVQHTHELLVVPHDATVVLVAKEVRFSLTYLRLHLRIELVVVHP